MRMKTKIDLLTAQKFEKDIAFEKVSHQNKTLTQENQNAAAKLKELTATVAKMKEEASRSEQNVSYLFSRTKALTDKITTFHHEQIEAGSTEKIPRPSIAYDRAVNNLDTIFKSFLALKSSGERGSFTSTPSVLNSQRALHLSALDSTAPRRMTRLDMDYTSQQSQLSQMSQQSQLSQLTQRTTPKDSTVSYRTISSVATSKEKPLMRGSSGLRNVDLRSLSGIRNADTKSTAGLRSNEVATSPDFRHADSRSSAGLKSFDLVNATIVRTVDMRRQTEPDTSSYKVHGMSKTAGSFRK